MKNILPIAFILIIFYGIYNSIEPCGTIQTKPNLKTATKTKDPNYLQGNKSLDEKTYEYVLNVINHGSSKLHFKKEEIMEGGYIVAEDAPKIACYVLKLSGKTCPAGTESAEASMLFSSVCAGCHGNDGKGIHGAYPDLTRPVLMGLER